MIYTGPAEKETRNLLAPSTSLYARGTPRGGPNPFSLEGNQLATRGDPSRFMQPPPPPVYDVSDYQEGGPLHYLSTAANPGVLGMGTPVNPLEYPPYISTRGAPTVRADPPTDLKGMPAPVGGTLEEWPTIQGPEPPWWEKFQDWWGKYKDNPFVQMGVRLGTGLLGNKLVGGPPGVPDAANLLAQQAANAQYGRQIAGQLGPVAQQLLGGATESFSPVANMWSGLLRGGRGRLTNLLAPEIGEITDAYRAPTQAMANLQPRGGARASLMAQLPYQKARDIATLFQQIRPMAAQGLLQVGQAQAQAGGAGYQNIANLLGGSSLAAATLAQYNLDRQVERNRASEEFGGTIYDVLFPSASGNTPASDTTSTLGGFLS